MKKPVKKQVSVADATKKTVKKVPSPKKAPSPKKGPAAKPAAAPAPAVKAAKAQKKKKEEEEEEEDGGEDDFLLPGQTKQTPDESDPLRIFYESLYRQRPGSKMAEDYCLQHGLLSEEKAQEVLNRLSGKSATTKARK